MHDAPTTCCPLMFPASRHSVKALNSWAPVPPLICSSQPTSTQIPKTPPSVTFAVLTASNSGVPHAVFKSRSVRRMLFVVPYACVGPPPKTCSSVEQSASAGPAKAVTERRMPAAAVALHLIGEAEALRLPTLLNRTHNS